MPVTRTGTNLYAIQAIRRLAHTFRNEGGWQSNEIPAGGIVPVANAPLLQKAIIQSPEVAEEGGDQTVALEAAVIRFLAPAQTVVVGGISVPLSPARIRLLAAAQTVVVGGVIAALTPAVLRLVAPPLTVVAEGGGDQTVELSPAVIRFLAPATTQVSGGVVAALQPAVVWFRAPALTVDLPGAEEVGKEHHGGGIRRGYWGYENRRPREVSERFDEIFEREAPEEERPEPELPTPPAEKVRGTEPAPRAPKLRKLPARIKSGLVRVGGTRGGGPEPSSGALARPTASPSVPAYELPGFPYAPPLPSEAAVPEIMAPVEGTGVALLAEDDDELLLVGQAVLDYYA